MTGAETTREQQSPIVQRCGVLREKIEQVKSRQGSEQTARNWRPIAETLPPSFEQAKRLADLLQNLRQRTLVVPGRAVVPPNLKRLFGHLDSLRNKLLNTPATVMERNTWANVKTGLAGALTALEDNLRGIWSEHVALLIPQVDHLKPFLNHGGCAADVRKIAALQAELKSLQQRLPAGDADFQKAEETSREIQKSIAKLDLGDVPPEVRRFIELVNSIAGATLSDLDERVLSWLREKRLLQGFRIK